MNVAPWENLGRYGLTPPVSVARATSPTEFDKVCSASSQPMWWLRTRPAQDVVAGLRAFGVFDRVPLTTHDGTGNKVGFTAT